MNTLRRCIAGNSLINRLLQEKRPVASMLVFEQLLHSLLLVFCSPILRNIISFTFCETLWKGEVMGIAVKKIYKVKNTIFYLGQTAYNMVTIILML